MYHERMRWLRLTYELRLRLRVRPRPRPPDEERERERERCRESEERRGHVFLPCDVLACLPPDVFSFLAFGASRFGGSSR